ncbi:MAG: hypothetical protein Q9M13_03665 [Mariprofundales bacterium]|nr:hypothetical protein [Mariprofundales bacterium]
MLTSMLPATVADMRALALMAFFALQLSLFTCGFTIHLHADGSATDQVAAVVDMGADSIDHQQGSQEHSCYIHASHAFSMAAPEQQESAILGATFVHQYALSCLRCRELALLIEHPPKLLHS